jgi:hypothetical protein
MRKILIKYLWGVIFYKLPFTKSFIQTDRGATINMLGILAFIFVPYLINGMEFSTTLTVITFIWFSQILYLGFPLWGLGYFEKYPVNWSELDNLQRWYFVKGIVSGDLDPDKAPKLKQNQLKEYQKLDEKLKQKLYEYKTKNRLFGLISSI